MSNDSLPKRNFLELRVCGLQRSGNHAIINWILDQHHGKASCFLNNVRHGDHDPFKTARQCYLKKLRNTYDVEHIRNTQKHVLVYSYEDDLSQMQKSKSFIESVYDKNFEEVRDQYIGLNEKYFDVIIIRDPFNFFASRIEMLESLTGTQDLGSIKNDWKELAKLSLDVIKNSDEKYFVIKYNDWFSDKKYRVTLCQQLYGNFSDDSLSSLSYFGGGSSFDLKHHNRLTLRILLKEWKKIITPARWVNVGHYVKRLFAPGAQSMRVLERWKNVQDNVRFQRVLADREVLELSENLFGQIPGTREFVEQCIKWHASNHQAPLQD